MNSSPLPGLCESKNFTDAIDIAETLGNLAYLIRMDADDPRLVRTYADLAEERLRKLGELLRSSSRMPKC